MMWEGAVPPAATSIRSPPPPMMSGLSSVSGGGLGRDPSRLRQQREDAECNDMEERVEREEEEEAMRRLSAADVEGEEVLRRRASEVEEEPPVVASSGSRPTSSRALDSSSSSSSSSSRQESEKEVVLVIEECRICKEGGGGEMIKPCECGGTMARVHLKCLQQWISRRRHVNISEAGRCEICKSDYKLRIKEEFECSLARLCSFASLSFYAEFITILVTLTAMVALLFLFFKSRQNNSKVTLYVAVIMGLSVLALGCFTLIKVSVRWRRANSVPVITPLSPARLLPHDPA